MTKDAAPGEPANPGAAADPLIGSTLEGRYTLRERLGAGGMSVVYRAEQAAMEREVAVKLLADRPTLEAVQRFHREMRASARLSHPNCVQVHDFGQTEDNKLFLVMELVRGETLGSVLRREGRLAPRRAAHLAAQIARGAGAAHARGLVHRDLKPDNVMVTAVVGEPELVKVLDFGIVQASGDDAGQPLTRSGAFAGTPRYAAPEQARREGVGPATDLYALGLILFEMVAGRLPRDRDGGGSPERLRAADPAAPPALDALVASLLERDPARRPARADEVARQLAAIAAAVSLRAVGGRSRGPSRFPRAAAHLLVFAAAFGAGIGGTALIAQRRPAQRSVAPSATPVPSTEPDPEPVDTGPPTGVKCAGYACPALDGYAPSCNAQHRCEYARAARTEPWHEHDAWIYVRASAFSMGSRPPREGDDWPTSETPKHTVALRRGFFIARHEVTTALHEACEAAKACAPPGAPEPVSRAGGKARAPLVDLGVPANRSAQRRGNHPQNVLTWADARAVCGWLGGRLPSEAEWELSAGGPEGYVFAWGGRMPSPRDKRTGNFADTAAAARWKGVEPIPGYQDGYADTAPVGSFPNGVGKAFGALDLAGNVAEWVEDCHHPSYDGAPADGSPWTYDCDIEDHKVVRGGGFLDHDVRAGARDRARPRARSPAIGARCVRGSPSTAGDDARWKQKMVRMAAELRCLEQYVKDPTRLPSERTRVLWEHGLARFNPTSNVYSQGSIRMPISPTVDPDAVVRVLAGADPQLGAAVDRAAAACLPAVPPGSDAERARMLEAFTAVDCARKLGRDAGAAQEAALRAAGVPEVQWNHAVDRYAHDADFTRELDARVEACAAGDGGATRR